METNGYINAGTLDADIENQSVESFDAVKPEPPNPYSQSLCHQLKPTTITQLSKASSQSRIAHHPLNQVVGKYHLRSRTSYYPWL